MSDGVPLEKPKFSADLAQRAARLMPMSKFHPPMEAAYQEEMAALRVNRALRSGWVAVVLYLVFSVSDPIMLPDAYHKAWLIRLLTAPFLILGIIGTAKLPNLVLRDVASAGAIILCSVSLAWIAALSNHPNAAHYHTGIILVALFGNIVLSMRFRAAVIMSIAIMAIYALCLANIRMVDANVRFNIWMVFFAATIISLLANYQMDRDRRAAFFARSREEERNEELSHAVELLKKLSTEDALTQIANRRELDYRLKIEWGRARREGQSLAMILIDIDFFKYYNDHYGHPAGDHCLKQIAATLRTIPQRSSDLVARFGGEEFVVLLPGTTLEDAGYLAKRMRQAILDLNIPHLASQVAPMVTASFGVAAIMPLAQDDPAQLLANADAALYRAKENGRNQVAVQAP